MNGLYNPPGTGCQEARFVSESLSQLHKCSFHTVLLMPISPIRLNGGRVMIAPPQTNTHTHAQRVVMEGSDGGRCHHRSPSGSKGSVTNQCERPRVSADRSNQSPRLQTDELHWVGVGLSPSASERSPLKFHVGG